MNSESENRENDYEKAEKSGTNQYNRYLKVQSVVYPSRKDIELQRKSHSSPHKSYRRMSGVEVVEKQVCVAGLCAFVNKYFYCRKINCEPWPVNQPRLILALSVTQVWKT